MSDLSRRSLLAGIPAVAVTMATSVAGVAVVAVAAASDPVFVAITAHRDAWQAFDDAADDSMTKITEAERITGDAEDAAWATLLVQRCTTYEAVKAKADYLLNCARAKGLRMGRRPS